MLNITPASAEAITAQTADAFAAQAATRPLAGFGAGAFTCEGALTGTRRTGMAAGFASPGIKSAFAGISPTAISKGHAQAGAAGAGYRTSLVDAVQVDSVQRDANNNFIQMARLYPVTPGGVGPHPAREPVPV